MLLFVAMCTVLLGTLYPLLIDALGAGKLSVGAPYFNRVFVPLMIPMLILMGIAPHVRWRKDTLSPYATSISASASLLLALLLPMLVGKPFLWPVFIGLSLACWIACMTFAFLVNKVHLQGLAKVQWRQWGMIIAHLGIAVSVVGIVCSSAYKIERDVSIKPGAIITLASYTIQFDGIKNVEAKNYRAEQGHFTVSNGKQSRALYSEKRVYTVSKTCLLYTSPSPRDS